MLETFIDDAIADHKLYGHPEAQHALFVRLRRDDPVHWTAPHGYRLFGPSLSIRTSSRSMTGSLGSPAKSTGS
jgi:hypothetical protein